MKLAKWYLSKNEILNLVSLSLSVLSLSAAIVTGYFDAKTASKFLLISFGAIWIIWLTIKLLYIESTLDKKNLGSKKPWVPYTPKITKMEKGIHKIDELIKIPRISGEFLSWPRFTMLFWVNITEEFIATKNNRYLFSYKSETIPPHKYKNAFYLGIRKASVKEGEKEWRLLVGGEDYNNQQKIEFGSHYDLLGWKLIALTWHTSNRVLEFSIDGGEADKVNMTVQPDHWPSFSGNEKFTIGCWTDWIGGISFLEYYNFRIFSDSLTVGEIQEIHKHEKELLKNHI